MRHEAASRAHRPSLRGRLLVLLLVPMLIALVLDALVTYSVALAYANHVQDSGLADDTRTVARMLREDASHVGLSSQARFLLEYDPDGRDYFSIWSAQTGLIDGSPALMAPRTDSRLGHPPVLANARLNGEPMRVASMTIPNPRKAGDRLTISIAGNLRARQRQARQILVLAVPMQATLILVLLLLVRYGVRSGLEVLDPLTRRLASCERELTPIEDRDVPVELLPLTRAIDGLFARQRELIALHERFISDAAHQLRTPLTGLALHVERAQAHAKDTVVLDALHQVGTLTARVKRTANQLLALTRAQAPPNPRTRLQAVDMADLLRRAIEPRLHEAWRAGVDLGYEGPTQAAPILGDPGALEELVDNLIDNALRYAGREGSVTLGLSLEPNGSQCMSIEDDGPGIDDASLRRLGERFFRAPSASDEGTGLGLAIVGHIAERHHARLLFKHAPKRGLRVEIHFQPLESTA